MPVEPVSISYKLLDCGHRWVIVWAHIREKIMKTATHATRSWPRDLFKMIDGKWHTWSQNNKWVRCHNGFNTSNLVRLGGG